MIICEPDKNEFEFMEIEQQVKELSDKREKETHTLCNADIAQLNIILIAQDIQVIINGPCVKIFVFYEKERVLNSQFVLNLLSYN
jgi:hypothetical protein